MLRRVVIAGLFAAVATVVVVSAESPPQDTPLPLPDVTFYGATIRDDGTLIRNGTISAMLPRGTIISGEIAQVTGTNYTYSMAVPLSMYSPDNGNYAPGSVRAGEAIRFYVNNVLAHYRDANGFTHNEFVVPDDAMGQTYVLTLTLIGPDAYPTGDVNANGRRDAADALLVLKYDVGLISGVTDFPPPQRTIYLPLCDIVEDGQCNSSDALRILQCDVGLPDVDCPDQTPVVRLQDLVMSSPDAPLVLRIEVVPGADPDHVVVRLMADDPQVKLGAASLDLRYDADLLAAEACTENPDGSLDAAACNVGFRSDAVRLNAVTLRGAGGAETPTASPTATVLAEVTFRLRDPAAVEAAGGVARVLSLAASGVFDANGDDLAWRLDRGVSATPSAGGSDLYLPLIFRMGGGVSAAPSAQRHDLYLPLIVRTGRETK
jgi:hypothetical protein